MGRYPFRECVNRVMAAYEGYRSPSTLEVMKRRYNRMERELGDLFAQGRVTTTNPKYLTPEDVEAYFMFLRGKTGKDGRSIKPDSLKKDLIDLDKLCRFEGNTCVGVFKGRCPYLTRSDSRDRLPVFSKAEIARIVSGFGRADESDIVLLRSYALVALYFGAGLRTVEAVHAEASCIYLDDEGGSYIDLFVVKGSGTYGHPRRALILPPMVPVLRKYLDWRAGFLRAHGVECPYVFFSLDTMEQVTDKTIRIIRGAAERDLGMSFDGRKCRRSYGQYLKDRGVEIECISMLMGHNKTETTEEYYARISSDMAFRQSVEALRH